MAQSKLPIIISLEVHTSHKQQELMVEIMQDCWKGMLVDTPNLDSDTSNHDIPLPSLEDLLEKILIKVKFTPPKPPAEGKPIPKVLKDLPKEPLSSSSPSSSSDEVNKIQPEKKPKIHASLSKLGIYTRSYHFKSFDQPGR